ncbi:MAG: hypothetical protein WKF96_02855 [Solirubrobacteraceae bacterium]
MWFPIATVCALACAGVAWRCERRGPLLLALYAWVCSLLLASPILFTYSVRYSLEADVFIGVCLTVTTALYLIVRRLPRDPPSQYTGALELRAASVMGVLGIAGCLLLLADARASGLQFSVTYLLDNLNQIRDSQFEALAESSDRGAIGTVGGLAAPCGLLCILAAVRLGRNAGRTLLTLAVVNALLIAVISLGVLAGRATITNVVLLSIVSLYLSGRRLFVLGARRTLIAVVAVIGAWYLSTSWVATREDDTAADYILEETQRAQVRPWLKSVTGGNESSSLALVTIGYFASPIPTLHYYLADRDLPGPFYGAYSFPLPARLVGTVDGTWTRTEWYSLRQEVFTPIASRGYFDNVWSTWLRDLLVDFGHLGAILFCALFGSFMAWARNRSDLTGALHYHYLEVIACFTMGFGAFTSFLFNAFMFIPFVAALIIMCVVRASVTARTQPLPAPAATGDGATPQPAGAVGGRTGV